MTESADPLSRVEPGRVLRGRFGLFGHLDFRRLWIGDTISQFGTQVSLLAIPFIATVLIHASAFEVALLGTIEFLPFLLLTLPAGAWADQLRRRPILIAGDLLRAAALVTIPIAWELGALTIWQLYVVGFISGIGTVFFDVAYQSYLPSLVHKEDWSRATASSRPAGRPRRSSGRGSAAGSSRW